MAQSKSVSLLEAGTGTIIGLAVSLLSQLVIFPHYGVHVTLDVNLKMTAWFTLVSVVRSYGVRRLFNRVFSK